MKNVGICSRVAELGSLSSGAKLAMKIFVKRVFTIFATSATLKLPTVCKSCQRCGQLVEVVKVV